MRHLLLVPLLVSFSALADEPPPRPPDVASAQEPFSAFGGRVTLSMGFGTFGETFPVSSVKVPGQDRGQFCFMAGMSFFLGAKLPWNFRGLVVGQIGYSSSGIFPPRAADGLSEGIGFDLTFERWKVQPFVRALYTALVFQLREKPEGALAYNASFVSVGAKFSVLEAHVSIGKDFAGGISPGFGLGLNLIY